MICGTARGTARTVCVFGAADLVVVTGLPGSGKSTLMRRAVTRPRASTRRTPATAGTRRMPGLLPYAVYRPLVRIAHYAGLRRALRSGEGVVVHDCGTQAWVRRWLAREARRRGGALHLLLLDVTAGHGPGRASASAAAASRGTPSPGTARAVGRLLRAVEEGGLPAGCASAVLLDRAAADVLRRIDFDDERPRGGGSTLRVASRQVAHGGLGRPAASVRARYAPDFGSPLGGR